MSVTTRHSLICPACGGYLWGSTSLVGDAVPRPGDGTVCEACGAMLVFTPTTLRRLEDADLAGFSATGIATLTAISQHIQRFKPQRRLEDS